MEGFAAQVEQHLLAVRDLFGSVSPLDGRAPAPARGGAAGAQGWSGRSAQGHAEAVSASGDRHVALRDADAALESFRQSVAGDTAAARSRMDALIAAARASAADLLPQAGSPPGASALASSLADCLRQANLVVTGEADRVAARREQLAALADEFAAAAPPGGSAR